VTSTVSFFQPRSVKERVSQKACGTYPRNQSQENYPGDILESSESFVVEQEGNKLPEVSRDHDADPGSAFRLFVNRKGLYQTLQEA